MQALSHPHFSPAPWTFFLLAAFLYCSPLVVAEARPLATAQEGVVAAAPGALSSPRQRPSTDWSCSSGQAPQQAPAVAEVRWRVLRYVLWVYGWDGGGSSGGSSV